MRAVAGMVRTTASHARAPVGKPPVARNAVNQVYGSEC